MIDAGRGGDHDSPAKNILDRTAADASFLSNHDDYKRSLKFMIGLQLEFARCTITTLEHVFVFRGCLPGRAHVEQIHEEVIGERLRSLGEDAVLGLSEVGIQDAHTANENRHLRCGQRQQLRPIDQQFLCRYG